ncbi:MAG TPA: hypothetical protein VJN42_08780 [Candidatus Acidoferrum sp.]|nr:hypothetical protein [Candidatus Acidoferrum sp.]
MRWCLRWLVPAVLGLVAGFLALAFAVPAESSLPAAVVTLFSPGLKVAELAVPASHHSLATTFGWFLRIAIGVNAVFYFVIFALLAFFLIPRRSKGSS